MEVDPLWVAVEAGRRYTRESAMEVYPELTHHNFDKIEFEVARKPKTGDRGARDVKTYDPRDVEAFVARLAAPPEPEPADPLWLEVEDGTRYSANSAIERYPELNLNSFVDLPFVLARRPKTGKDRHAHDVKTFAAADVDALVARLAAPEVVDPRWLEVEAGARCTGTGAVERHPAVLTKELVRPLPFELARRPKAFKGPRDVKTYAVADVDALAAQVAAPQPEADPLWVEVEEGRRHTLQTAIERHPVLTTRSLLDLDYVLARRKKLNKYDSCLDVKTFSAADVDALAAKLAAPEPVDPLWLAVEAGLRHSAASAIEKYPQLRLDSFHAHDVPFEMARRPKVGKDRHAHEVKTYLASDVDALVAKLATPEPLDPKWRDVEEGRRYTATTAVERYPCLNKLSFQDLPFELARKPKIGKARYACDVKTYLAADIEALAAKYEERHRLVHTIDPKWLDVEAGRRYTAKSAVERYPHLNNLHRMSFADLPFELARKPKLQHMRRCPNVRTYLAADVDALAAERAKQQALAAERVTKTSRPADAAAAAERKRPRPDLDAARRRAEDEGSLCCPVCQKPLDGTAILACGHLCHRGCIDMRAHRSSAGMRA